MRRRVSSPDCGAISSATAAPVRAPITNATITVPAPLSSRSIVNSLPSRASENTDLDVQVLLWILPDVGDKTLELIRRVIHIVIQLLVVQELSGRPLSFIQVARQLVEMMRGA